jgi:hypothetical protein
MKQAGPDRLARMNRHHGTSTIYVTKEVMAASDANRREAASAEGRSQLRSGETWIPTHAAIVMR